MPNFETHVIVGHVGGDPALRYLNDGVAVCNISVAVNDPRQKDAPPTWYRVACWRATAEFVNNYVTKGAAVLVHGDRLRLSEWTGEDGQRRTSLELNAVRVELLDKRDNGASGIREESDMPF